MPKTEPFDKYSQRYDKWYDKHEYVFKSELKALKSLYHYNGNGVEIGVGSGRFAQELGIENGVEPSRQMRKLARRRGINIIEGQAEDISAPDEVYNYCLMVNTLCFLDDVNRAFSEINRVLENRGIFVVGFIDRESQIGKKYQDKKNDNVFYREAKFLSIEEVRIALLDNHFKIIQNVHTLFNNIYEINEIQPIKNGYGEGSFVVIKAEKL